ncbi:hypothetical protein CHELA1G11_10881 [Hyphomicrobiales bacterium]|nr:hypothetical protein CHELA1G11_10881 [Hyphomicrobiales bacterium]CAH1671671.1 hypothetical protein CHELA1G2_13429 [Hyphomicrobiales bacterium]
MTEYELHTQGAKHNFEPPYDGMDPARNRAHEPTPPPHTEGTAQKFSKMEGHELDYWVARALGFRFYLEQRGEYRLAVRQCPDAECPWHNRYKNDSERYTEVFTFADIQCGFFGDGVPPFSSEWQHGGPIIYRNNIGISPPNSMVHRHGGPLSGWGESGQWSACTWHNGVIGRRAYAWHDTEPLVAAMRCFLVSKYGEHTP